MFGTRYLTELVSEYKRKVSHRNKDIDHLLYILFDGNSEPSVNGV